MQAIFKALNDEVRREILELLKSRDMTAGEIADHFHLGKPTISHHLDLLRQADLVSCRKKGQFVIYTIETSVIDEVLKWMMGIANQQKTKQTKTKPTLS
ncbi:MAG: autorepressor SdpR family transcription factor [Saprospiraceae bacterium]